jgi:hypothetical protein
VFCNVAANPEKDIPLPFRKSITAQQSRQVLPVCRRHPTCYCIHDCPQSGLRVTGERGPAGWVRLPPLGFSPCLLLHGPYHTSMLYRTIEIAWLPRSQTDWRTFSTVRKEAANVWNWLVEVHADTRAGAESWPSKAEWQKRAKGRFSNLHSQSVQQTIADFCEAVTATTVLRHDSRPDARYPFRKPKYRCVIFTNQAARVRDGVLTLPCGQAGRLRVRVPEGVSIPGRLMEVRLHFGKVELVCQVPDVVHPTGPVIGIDLGVNTLLAATDGERAVLVSGPAGEPGVQCCPHSHAGLQTGQRCSRQRSVHLADMLCVRGEEQVPSNVPLRLRLHGPPRCGGSRQHPLYRHGRPDGSRSKRTERCPLGSPHKVCWPQAS